MRAVPLGGMWGRPVRGARHPTRTITDRGVTYAVQSVDEDTMALTAAAPELTCHKIVSADGRTRIVLRHGADCVHLATGPQQVTVARGARDFTVDLGAPDARTLRRVRRLFLGSPAVRLFRALAVALEDAAAGDPERMGIRLTAAALACLDGDDGAVRRLSRELAANAGATWPPADSPHTVGRLGEFRQALLTARAELVRCSGPLYWNALQIACGFAWIQQVEQAWFRRLARASSSIADPGRLQQPPQHLVAADLAVRQRSCSDGRRRDGTSGPD